MPLNQITLGSSLEDIMPGIKRKRCSYDARFKLKVVQFAIDNNNNSKASMSSGVELALDMLYTNL